MAHVAQGLPGKNRLDASDINLRRELLITRPSL